MGRLPMSIMLLHAVLNSMEVSLPCVAKSTVEPGTEYFSTRMRSMPAGFLISRALFDKIQSGNVPYYKDSKFVYPQIFLSNLQEHAARTIKRIVNKTPGTSSAPVFLHTRDLTDYLQAVTTRSSPGALKFGSHGQMHRPDSANIENHIRLQATIMAEHTAALREMLLFASHSFDNAQYSQTNDAEAHGIVAYTVMSIALCLISQSETLKFLDSEIAKDVMTICQKVKSGVHEFANMYAAFGYNLQRLCPTDAWAWTGYLRGTDIFLSNAYKSMLEYSDSSQLKKLKAALGEQLELFLNMADPNAAVPKTLHKSTQDLLDKNSKALHDKLLAAQIKHNLVNGWRMPSEENIAKSGDGRFFTDAKSCAKALIHHMHKGDLQDVIVYSMYLQELLAEEGLVLADVIVECNTRKPKGTNPVEIKWRVKE